MRKLRATYLGVLVLGWLLSFGTQVAWAYYPYLTVTVTYGTHSVEYSVYNPQKQQGYSASHSYPGTVVTLQQHNNVITWVVHDGNNYFVEMVTFDPGLNTFQNHWDGDFTSVAQLQVVDGVVAYVADIPATQDTPAHSEFKYCTYDPGKGFWQQGQYWPGGGEILGTISYSSMNLATKDGAVVLRWSAVYTNPNHTTNYITWDIYDPKLGRWWPSHVGLSNYNSEDPFTFVFISGATIHFTADQLNWTIGYNPLYDFPFANPWDVNKSTTPLPYFVAQPDFGKKPLWVWFTDMSIGGSTWSWNFGDNSTSTFRSPYHTFTSTGIFQVSQQINGNSTYSHEVTVVNTFDFNKGSLPASLYLLLNND